MDNFDYVVFVSSDSSKGFGCGREGHLIRVCPEKSLNKTGEGQKEKQVDMETQEGTGQDRKQSGECGRTGGDR